eukprot:6187050-Pleurochrysis_carterae.AAC.3
MLSSSVPSITAAGEAAACSKKARAVDWQHVKDVRVGADRAQQHLERRLADECGHCAPPDALAAKAGEDRIAQLPASLGAQIGVFLQVGAQAAGLREALCDGCVDEEDAVAKAADGQHVLDRAEQLVVKGLLLLAVELRVEPLPTLRANGVALGRVSGGQGTSSTGR